MNHGWWVILRQKSSERLLADSYSHEEITEEEVIKFYMDMHGEYYHTVFAHPRKTEADEAAYRSFGNASQEEREVLLLELLKVKGMMDKDCDQWEVNRKKPINTDVAMALVRAIGKGGSF